jgi:hypothetical protein
VEFGNVSRLLFSLQHFLGTLVIVNREILLTNLGDCTLEVLTISVHEPPEE